MTDDFKPVAEFRVDEIPKDSFFSDYAEHPERYAMYRQTFDPPINIDKDGKCTQNGIEVKITLEISERTRL